MGERESKAGGGCWMASPLLAPIGAPRVSPNPVRPILLITAPADQADDVCGVRVHRVIIQHAALVAVSSVGVEQHGSCACIRMGGGGEACWVTITPPTW